MKRSAHITAPLVAALALTITTGCRKPMQRCVDEQNHVVDESFCQGQPNAQQINRNTGNGFFPIPIYRYYYGGYGGWGIGSTVTGGGYTATPGQSYSRSGSTSRGGFGSSGASGYSGAHGASAGS